MYLLVVVVEVGVQHSLVACVLIVESDCCRDSCATGDDAGELLVACVFTLEESRCGRTNGLLMFLE